MIRSRFLPILLLLAAVLTACSDAGTTPTPTSIAAPLPNITIGTDGNAPPPIPAAPKVPARGYYLFDFDSSQVLAAMKESERLDPASLTKLMSAYAVFHALKDGRIKLADQVRISKHARAQEGSRMFIEVNTLVPVEDLIQGMIVQSGNDATVALAEHVAGSEPVFVDLMNQYAAKLGMSGTHFRNSPGLPDPEHYSTARDIGVLAAALIRDYPQYYKWYSQREYTWNKITQPNRNGLLERDPSVDGLKTGRTDTAGFCLVSSARREGRRLVSVVMGTASIAAREDASAALLNYGFAFYETRKLFSATDVVLPVRLWKGTAKEARLIAGRDIVITVPRGQASTLRATVDVPTPLIAPLAKTQTIGKLRIMSGERLLGEYPLHPVEDVAEAGFVGRWVDDVKLWME